MRGEVAVLSRNVVIQGDVKKDTSQLNDMFGAHIKVFCHTGFFMEWFFTAVQAEL